jgi:replication initiation protein RepC
VAAQVAASDRPPDKVVHKWKLFRTVCVARPRLGVSERALSVLNALLTFYPETMLTGDDPHIVFPSNEQLMLRAHGMPVSTLRRHLAALVDAGLIIRRDSPNGKRYARKGRGGEIGLAFGFDLSPLVARQEQFAALAAEIEAEALAMKLARERITLCRRDIAKMISVGLEEGVSTGGAGQGPACWHELYRRFRTIVEALPRAPTHEQLEVTAEGLTQLAEEIHKLLRERVEETNLSANESQIERHKHNSNPKPLIDLEPSLHDDLGPRTKPNPETKLLPKRVYPLGMVLDACPDIADYAKGGIVHWRDFLATATIVRSMLGISPSAWSEAQNVMGETQAAVVVSCILQRGSAIHSAGGYLRELTRKAGAGEFSIGPILMAQINSKLRGKFSSRAGEQGKEGTG